MTCMDYDWVCYNFVVLKFSLILIWFQFECEEEQGWFWPTWLFDSISSTGGLESWESVVYTAQDQLYFIHRHFIHIIHNHTQRSTRLCLTSCHYFIIIIIFILFNSSNKYMYVHQTIKVNQSLLNTCKKRLHERNII
jgi:hypothetical protein